ncbi:hypothetical protein [Peribacillus sp. NPDC097895]|uniref:hypothetical protein n=1 Tax=Peribacillus sp. NPDC097895 TaxID=3390619 RepID=UPI003D06D562
MKADKQIQGYSPQTLKTYNVQFNLLVNSFGNISIQELSTNSLKVYLGKAAEKLKQVGQQQQSPSLHNINIA